MNQQANWSHGGTMTIGSANANVQSSKNILQFLVSKLEGEFFDSQEKKVAVLQEFVMSLQKHKGDIDMDAVNGIYSELSEKMNDVPSIISFVELLEERELVTEGQSIQSIVGMPGLVKAVKMEFGNNVELSFRKELSSMTVEPEQMANVISTAFDADGANFIREGYLSFVETYRIIPWYYAIDSKSSIIEIIVSDFSNEGLRDIVQYLTRKFNKVQISISPKSEFDACLDKIRTPTESVIQDAFDEIGRGMANNDDIEDDSKTGLALDTIIAHGLDIGASDIHIIPHKATTMMAQYRVNGWLVDGSVFPIDLMPRFENKIIQLSGTSHSSVPVSGLDLTIIQTDREINGKKYSFQNRVNMTKVVFLGKSTTKIVMRIVNLKDTGGKKLSTFEALGMSKRNIAAIPAMCNKSDGLIVCVWPTGSGKTKTLYTILGKIIAENPHKRVITFEDPVEAPLLWAMQHQIDEDKNYGFAQAVPLALREDPDIILVGEMRDKKTAEMCVELSMTGHLTFSTLHTNDAVATIGRMERLGIHGAEIAEQLIAIISQRLELKVCPHCKEAGMASGKELNDIIESMEVGKKVRYRFDPEKRYSKTLGSGCDRCVGTGISGRMAIYEIFQPNKFHKGLISGNFTSIEIYDKIWEHNETLDNDSPKRFISMFEDGLEKVGEWFLAFDKVKEWTSSLSL